MSLGIPSYYDDKKKDKQANENLAVKKAPAPAASEIKVAAERPESQSPESKTIASAANQSLSLAHLDLDGMMDDIKKAPDNSAPKTFDKNLLQARNPFSVQETITKATSHFVGISKSHTKSRRTT